MGVSRASQYVTLEDLVPKIQERFLAYRSDVLNAIQATMDENAKDFIREAKKLSPYDKHNHKTPHYKNSWAVKRMRKAKYVKYIGNTKKVKGHYNDAEPKIPLINILEFTQSKNEKGESMARPVVAKALENCEDQIINRIIEYIQKAGK